MSKRRLLFWFIISMGVATPAAVASAQEGRGATVTIQIREADGSPLVGESIMLVTPPADDPVPPLCATDHRGECSWFVTRGVYSLHFNGLYVDEISLLGPAEAGLTGLSITVGDADIRYYFAVANGAYIYFDLAPDQPMPQPFIPTLEDVWHDHYRPLPETLRATPQLIVATAMPTAVAGSSSIERPSAPPAPAAFTWEGQRLRLRFLLTIAAGCLLGGVAFWRQQRRRSTLGPVAATAVGVARSGRAPGGSDDILDEAR
jgi:hypothetical protein